MHPEFGDVVQAETDRIGHRAEAGGAFWSCSSAEYLQRQRPLPACINRTFQENRREDDTSACHLLRHPVLRGHSAPSHVSGEGNGPIDAFFNAVHGQDLDRYTFVDYMEHAINDRL